MNDPTWVIEEALVAAVSAYTEETATIAAILEETIASPIFAERYGFPLDLEVFTPEDNEEGSFLNGLEDYEGRERGAIVELSFIDAEDPAVAEVHVSASTVPIIVLHELAHALTRGHDDEPEWLAAFEALTMQRYGPAASYAFDGPREEEAIRAA